MSKRQRAEISQTFSLSHPSRSINTTYSRGTDVPTLYITSTSKIKGKKPTNLSLADLTNILCPVVRVDNTFKAGYLKSIAIQDPVQLTNAYFLADNQSMLSELSNRQGFYSFVSLPKHDCQMFVNNTYFNGLTVDQMINKIIDTRTFPSVAPANPIIDTALQYLGGSTTYTFVNMATTDAYFAVHISKPRRPLQFRNPVGQPLSMTPINFTWPSMLSLQDKMDQRNSLNGLQPQHDSTYPNETADITFKYTSNDKKRIYNYSTASSYRKVAPGQTLIVKIAHPPFMFTNAEFLDLMNIFMPNPSDPMAGDEPFFLPFCTQVLDVAIKGELSSGSTLENEDETPTIGRENQLCHSATNVLVKVHEKHAFRSIPNYQREQYIYKNFLNQDIMDKTEHIDEETQELKFGNHADGH